MKICLIMNDNSYSGRQYAFALNKAGIPFDVVNINNFPEKNDAEDARCCSLWQPPLLRDISKQINISRFSSLKDPLLKEHLNKKDFYIAIQGGTGILKSDIIQKFKYGILNFHPGDLPYYRGCSAPEWQIYELKNIIVTCHFIDEGIDTGDILVKSNLKLNSSSYYSMRASIYPEVSKFLVSVLERILNDKNFLSTRVKQNHDEAIYRKYIGQEKIDFLISNWDKIINDKKNSSSFT